MKAKRLGACVLLASVCAGAPFPSAGCNLGPFPDFLERLDPLRPVEGEVKGWILAQEHQTQVLILSQSGRFLHSQVGRDMSVILETGSFEIDRNDLVMRSDYRYIFPRESGPVSDREGAQSEEVNVEKRRAAAQSDERLTIEGFGTFVSTSDYVLGLDLTAREDRGCLLKYIQLSIRTIQARIRNFGGGGTAIYHNNKSAFVGFLAGEQSIVVDNLLSPDTTITYNNFQDFPEILLDGSFVSHVNTSGDGTLDESVNYTIFDTSRDGEMGLGGQMGLGGPSGPHGEGGQRGMGGAPSWERVLAHGKLVYGPNDPIRIQQGEVVGGSYQFEVSEPTASSDKFSWELLEDLDLRECSVFALE